MYIWMADGRCLGFRDKEVQGTCLGMLDMEGRQVGRSKYLGNKFLFYIEGLQTYRSNVVLQLNLVLIFERYEMSTYVCEIGFWVLLIGLLN